MPWNGSGTFSLDPAFSPAVNGTVINATDYNGLTTDLATGVSNALAKDGQNAVTADLNMGGKKLTNMAVATVATDAVRLSQVDMVGSASVASAATVNIFTANEQLQNITGTTTVSSFGVNTLGQIRFIKAINGFTLTYNATSMIIPGGGSLALAAGDMAIVKGLGSSNAEIFSISRAAGLSTLVSELGNANIDRTLVNGIYKQQWGWVFSSTNQKGFYLEGRSNGGGTFGTVLTVEGSTNGASVSKILEVIGGDSGGSQSIFSILQNSQVTLAGGVTSAAVAADTTIQSAANAGTGSSAGAGTLFLKGGASSQGNGGPVTIAGGATSTSAVLGGNVLIQPGAAVTTALSGSLTLANSNASIALVFNRKVSVISSGGGSGGTIRGTDNFFEVTIGTGSPANVVVGFSTAKATVPMVLLSSSADEDPKYVATTGGVTITPRSGTWSSGTKITGMIIEAT